MRITMCLTMLPSYVDITAAAVETFPGSHQEGSLLRVVPVFQQQLIGSHGSHVPELVSLPMMGSNW